MREASALPNKVFYLTSVQPNKELLLTAEASRWRVVVSVIC
jgi:hypothetical protein